MERPPLANDLAGYAFGPFLLSPRERTLREDGRPVRLSDKPLDILIALVSRAGDLVTKEELLSVVWPGVTVGEGSLRVHIVALRKALGEIGGAARYILTQAGRGYQFIAPIEAVPAGGRFDPRYEREPEQAPAPRHSASIIGRDEMIAKLSAQVLARRLTTIVGPGGVGKSTVASGVAEALRPQFEEVRFLDLAPLNDAQLLPTAISLLFDIRVASKDAIATLAADIAGRRILLVLDGCEHLIETAALIIEQLLETLPQLQILATSREALRLSQERIYRLAPLGAAPVDVASAEELMAYPAAQLFVERATAAWQDFVLDDMTARTISRICHALDGLPLAIELAVGQLAFLGLEDLARGLADPLPILARGRRTAQPRQRTLRATLDWSYDLLSGTEQTILRRLGVFRARFDLDAAAAVARDATMQPSEVLDGMAGLVAKSIVSVEVYENTAIYRLLDTTRAYARARLEEAGEWDETSRCHAEYLLDRLKFEIHETHGQIVTRIRNGEVIDDMRAALAWAYAQPAETELFRTLALSVTFVLVQKASIEEARTYLQQAVDRLQPSERGTLAEFNLRLYLSSTSPIVASSDKNLAALIAMAEDLDDPIHVVRTLELSFLTRLRVADYRGAANTAQRIAAILAGMGSAAPKLTVEWMEGVAAHFMGDYAAAESAFDAVLNTAPDPEAVRYSGDPVVYARGFLSRVLWVTGREREALREAEVALALLPATGHPMFTCTMMMWLCQLWYWIGDLDRVEALCGQITEVATVYSMDTQIAMVGVWKGRIAVGRGHPAEALPILEESRRYLRQNQQEMLVPVLHAAFAEALVAIGDPEGSLREIDEGIGRAKMVMAEVFLPELMLVKARILAATGGDRGGEQALAHFGAALQRAASMGAMAWEAQAALELARQAIAIGRQDVASTTLTAVCARADLTHLRVMTDLQALLATLPA